MVAHHQASSVLPVVRAFSAKVHERADVQEVWLFGSWAYGSPHAESDIDVAVVLSDDDLSTESELLSSAHTLDRRLEIHGFTQADFNRGRRAILHDIKNKGIRIL